MADIDVPLSRIGFGKTRRKDAWWVTPALIFIVLTGFLVYAHWRVLVPVFYWHDGLLSPFFSPELFGNSPHSFFGAFPSWWPSWLPASPAMLILIFPAGFRFTCYYYRGSYYKAFWGDPPACSVGEPRHTYRGEEKLPLIIQNIHRYFMYAAVAFLFFLAYDVYNAMWFTTPGVPGSPKKFGISVGTLVLLLNVTLLSGYTLGCHSLRHLIGGIKDVLSRHPVRKACYDGVTCLNKKHHVWAWSSLFGVLSADVYVQLCARGIITDWRII